MAKLTKAQLDALRSVARDNDSGRVFSRRTHGTRSDVLSRLQKAGFLQSSNPFAWEFHSVTITDVGRAALREPEHG